MKNVLFLVLSLFSVSSVAQDDLATVVTKKYALICLTEKFCTPEEFTQKDKDLANEKANFEANFFGSNACDRVLEIYNQEQNSKDEITGVIAELEAAGQSTCLKGKL